MNGLNNLKVLYCITRSDTLGGAHVHVADMAAWMIDQGHEAIVLAGGDGPYTQYLADRQIPCVVCRHLSRPLNPLRDLRALREIRAMFRRMAPDIISLHSTKAGILGRLAAMRLPAPVLFTAHGWSFTEGVHQLPAVFYRWAEKLAAPLADRIITVSDYDRNLALSAGIGHDHQIITVHNAMPDSAKRAACVEHAGPVRFIMVARLDQQKDHHTLFRALAQIREYAWQLDLIGDGPLSDELQAEADRLGMGDRINFLGLRHDVDDWLQKADLFVLASRWEGLPRSILEAMRAGLPVIATAVGGIAESVADGETGLLVPRGDTLALRRSLVRLLDNPAERHQMGRAGRVRFETRFVFDRMAMETMVVYRQLIDNDVVAGCERTG